MTLTVERLKEVLHYEPTTGVWTWLVDIGNGVCAGDTAGSRHSIYRYIYISIDNDRFRAHRLAFFYMTGTWPTAEVDHKNLVRDDNRWLNLREATESQNAANSKLRAHNTSGYKGVSLKKGRWRAQINRGGKTHHLGNFDTPEEAYDRYCAEAKIAFGAFARHA